MLASSVAMFNLLNCALSRKLWLVLANNRAILCGFFSVSSSLCTVMWELNFDVLFRGQDLGVLETITNTLE